MRVSRPASSNRHTSTASAVCEKTAKLVPGPSQVAPSGKGSPGRMDGMDADLRAAIEVGGELVMAGALLQARSRTVGGFAQVAHGVPEQDHEFPHVGGLRETASVVLPLPRS